MLDITDLKLMLQSRVPIIVMETREEKRALGLFKRLMDALTERADVQEGAQTDSIHTLGREKACRRFRPILHF